MFDKQGSQHRSSNEGKACDADVRVMEQRTGAIRKDIHRPEKDRVVFSRGFAPGNSTLRSMLTEHTHIEALRRPIATGVWLMQLIDPVKKALCGDLPGQAIYKMIVPIDPSLEGTEIGLEQLQKNLYEVGIARALNTCTDRIPSQRSRRGSHMKSPCNVWCSHLPLDGNRGCLEPSVGRRMT